MIRKSGNRFSEKIMLNETARQSLRGGGRPVALIEAAVEDMFGDAVLQHFERAAGDHPAARSPHAIFDQRLAAIAERAHDLHGFVGDVKARLIAGGFGDGGLVGRRQATVGIGRGAKQQELGTIKLDRHIGELPLQALKFAQRPAELLALLRIVARGVEGIAAKRQRARGIAEPLDIETRHLLLKAAGAEQNVLRRNTAILESKLAPFLAAHEGLWRADGKTRRAAFNENRADAVEPRSEAHIDQKDMRIRTEGRK